MSKVTYIYCDKCGKLIDHETEQIRVIHNDGINEFFYSLKGRYYFCNKCVKKFDKYVSEFFDDSQMPQKEYVGHHSRVEK